MPSMKLMGLILLEKTSVNQLTDQRPAFSGKSLMRHNMQLPSLFHIGGHVNQV